MFDNIRFSVSDGVATITLARPEVSNGVDLATAGELRDAVTRVASDGAVRSVFIAGEGDRFCAGGDLAAMLAAPDRAEYVEQLALALDAVTLLLAELEKPVVAAVHGAVAGAGLALMLSCDLVLADESTKFVGAYSSIGFVPDCGLSWLLPRAVGQQRALEMLLTSRPVTAPEALSWGMLTAVTPNSAHDEGLQLAQDLADGPAWALGATRALIRGSWSADRAETGRREAATIARACVTPDAEALLKRFRR